MLSSGGTQIIQLASSVLIARFLGNEGFGEFSLVRSTILLFGVLAGTGLGIAATKHIAQFRESDPVVTGRLIALFLGLSSLLGGVACLLCIVLADEIAGLLLNAQHFESTLRSAAVLLLFNTVSGVQIGAIAGLEAFRRLAAISFFEAVAYLVLGSMGAYFWGVDGAVVGLVCAGAFSLAAKHQSLVQECRKRGIKLTWDGLSANKLRILGEIAIPASVISLSAQPVEWFLRILLVRNPNGLAEVAILTAAMSWGLAVQMIPAQIATPARPILASLIATRNTHAFRRLVWTSSGLALAAGTLVALPMSFLAPFLMRLYGESFVPGAGVLIVIVITYAMTAPTAVFTEALATAGRIWSQFVLRILWGMATLTVAVLLIEKGAFGIALACAAGNAVYLAAQAYLVRSLMRDLG